MTTRQRTVIEEDPATEQQPPARWWQRRRGQALIVALAVAAAASAGAVFAGTRGDGEDLPRKSPRTTYGYNQMEPGAEFSMGGVRIFEPGKIVQIVSAKALTSRSVEYLGAYTVWPRDYVPPPGTYAGFPYADQKVRHELTEPIPASETARFDSDSPMSVPITVTLGFRILTGMGGVNGIHLTYKVNGKTKTQYFPDAVIGCVKPLNCEDRPLTENDEALRELGLVRED